MTSVVDQALNEAIDIVAATEVRAHQLVRRCIAAVTATTPDVDELADCLRACCAYNENIGDSARRICRLLNSLEATPDEWSIKAVARRLRPALRVLADPHQVDAGGYVRAVRTVDDVAAVKGREWLLSRSMAHELRGKAFRVLATHLSFTRPESVGGRVATIGSSSHQDVVAAT